MEFFLEKNKRVYPFIRELRVHHFVNIISSLYVFWTVSSNLKLCFCNSNNLEVWPGTTLKVIDDLQSHSMNTKGFFQTTLYFQLWKEKKRVSLDLFFYLLGIFTFTLYEYCRIFDKLHYIITSCCLNNLQNIVWLSVSIFIVYWQFYSFESFVPPQQAWSYIHVYMCIRSNLSTYTVVLYVI